MPLKNEHHIGRAKNASLPAELRGDYHKAVRLEWITVTYLVSVAVVMYLATGSSQAMQAAWIEDVVSIFPSTTIQSQYQ